MAKQTATICCQGQTFVGWGFWNSHKNEWWIWQFNFSTQALSQISWKLGSKMCYYRAFSNELFVMQCTALSPTWGQGTKREKSTIKNTIFSNNWLSRGGMDAWPVKAFLHPWQIPCFHWWLQIKPSKTFWIGNGMVLSSVICLCIPVIIISNHRNCVEHVNKSC